ncbi:glycosyl transferase family 41-domain-containing protein [Paraphysoderma sedebokerense]|nr:glycosyl transferase family 41-domain-containing protein [Paraphysoderma sedebokerense]
MLIQQGNLFPASHFQSLQSYYQPYGSNLNNGNVDSRTYEAQSPQASPTQAVFRFDTSHFNEPQLQSPQYIQAQEESWKQRKNPFTGSPTSTLVDFETIPPAKRHARQGADNYSAGYDSHSRQRQVQKLSTDSQNIQNLSSSSSARYDNYNNEKLSTPNRLLPPLSSFIEKEHEQHYQHSSANHSQSQFYQQTPPTSPPSWSNARMKPPVLHSSPLQAFSDEAHFMPNYRSTSSSPYGSPYHHVMAQNQSTARSLPLYMNESTGFQSSPESGRTYRKNRNHQNLVIGTNLSYPYSPVNDHRLQDPQIVQQNTYDPFVSGINNHVIHQYNVTMTGNLPHPAYSAYYGASGFSYHHPTAIVQSPFQQAFAIPTIATPPSNQYQYTHTFHSPERIFENSHSNLESLTRNLSLQAVRSLPSSSFFTNANAPYDYFLHAQQPMPQQPIPNSVYPSQLQLQKPVDHSTLSGGMPTLPVPIIPHSNIHLDNIQGSIPLIGSVNASHVQPTQQDASSRLMNHYLDSATLKDTMYRSSAGCVEKQFDIHPSSGGLILPISGEQRVLDHTMNIPSHVNNSDWQEHLLQIAHNKYSANDLPAALSILQTLYLVNPTHIPTLLLLGCTCYSLSMYPLSIHYNQLILNIDPNFAEAFSNLGTTYRAMQDEDQAEKCYRRAVDIRPEYWDGVRNLVGVLCSKGRWKEAIKIYENAERRVSGMLCDYSEDPDLEGGHKNDFIYRKSEWPQERKRDLYYAKGNLKYAMSDLDGAKKEYRNALKVVGVDIESVVLDIANAAKLGSSNQVEDQLLTNLEALVQYGMLLLQINVLLMPPQQALNIAGSILRRWNCLTKLTATSTDASTTSSILQTLAKIHQDSHALAVALPMYYIALCIHPNPHTCNLLGILFTTLNHPSLAIQYYNHGLSLDPSHVHLYTNLGSVLKDQGHIMESIQMYEKAVQLNPEFEIALANLANAMKDIGRVDEACGLYKRALKANPNFIDAFCNYVNVLCFICDWRERDNNFDDLKKIVEKQLSQVLGSLSWSLGFPMPKSKTDSQHSLRSQLIQVARTQPPPPVPTVLPFHTFTYPLTPRQIRLISFRNAARIIHSVLTSSWLPTSGYFPPPLPSPSQPRLKIGYVSSDFGNHPLSHLMQSIFGFHDRSRFQVFCYALSANDGSEYRKKIEKEAEVFLDVSSWSTEDICNRINKVDGIHVLVNLNGYTKGARNEIFAARCAPVQLAYMGFAGTLGCLNWTDYLISDPIVCPPETVFPDNRAITSADVESHDESWVYTEKMIYMPHSYFVNDHKQGFRDDPEEDSDAVKAINVDGEEEDWLCKYRLDEQKRWRMRRELFPSIQDDWVVFANFNQLYKIDPEIFKTWLRILARVPKSILWLLRFPAAGEQHLRRTAEELVGPEVASRVVFTDVAPKHIHISRGRVVDLFLDTPECNAHTTACDILWSGTPIVTFPRHNYKMCSRVAASVAYATGFGDEMVVGSELEYEERCVELASTVRLRTENILTKHGAIQHVTTDGQLYDLKRKLWKTREASRLFDTKRWVMNLEKGMLKAWNSWEDGSLGLANIWVVDDDDGQKEGR